MVRSNAFGFRPELDCSGSTNWVWPAMKTWFVLMLLAFAPAAAFGLPAEDHWSREMDPETGERLEQAVRLIEDEAFADALPLLERLAFDLPGSADVYNLLGFAYRKTGDLERSAPAYKRALYLKPDHLGALEYQGELFLTQGNVEGAEHNLSLLDEFCALPCEERDELAEAIEAWRAENGE